MTAAGDSLGFSVLKGVTDDMLYTWMEGEELPNHLQLKIRNE